MLADMAFGKAAPIHLALLFGHLRFRNKKGKDDHRGCGPFSSTKIPAQAELERGTLETGNRFETIQTRHR